MTDNAGAAVQALLGKLLEIYDVKTLVAHLNGVGENRLFLNASWRTQRRGIV